MKKILNIIMVLGVAAVVATSCQKFLDVNKNPNVPTKAELNKLLTFAQSQTTYAVSPDGNYLTGMFSVFVHHMTVRESPNQYGLTPGNNVGIGNFWNLVYSYALPTYEQIITTAEEEKNFHYTGISKVMKAYTYMAMVDMFGDVPFSQASDPVEFPYPQVDDGAAIYNACFALLKDAKGDLATTTADGNNSLRPGSADIIYNGDVDKWIALANSLMFRMLNNTKQVKSQITGWSDLLTEAIAGPRIDTDSEFELLGTTTESPEDERFRGFARCYGVGQHTAYVSPWIYEIMKGYTNYNYPDNPLGGIVDPRIPYYFFNQSKSDGEAGGYQLSYRDGGFITILFGDRSGREGASITNYASAWGLYPAGGIYDNGEGNEGAVTKKDVGTQGAGIQKIYTYSDMLYEEAEMILAGEMAGDAKAKLGEAIDATFAHLNKYCKGKGGAPANGIESDAITTYKDAVLAKYDAANASEKLEHVMLQKWLHDVFNSLEAYNAYRRTGFPKLFDANTPGYGIDPSTGEERSTVCANAYPYSMWYPQGEIDRNKSMAQKQNQQVKPFWVQ
ncbi:MAG: SusD/RagB family nutrient-binding outer membrane lipoprotein [Bacteroidales bacterium]|jgi:hypothetical protein|nr:SusD/RagB family nutrient-binding outer membrane lipoprotein [Bacteroidales bacterium]